MSDDVTLSGRIETVPGLVGQPQQSRGAWRLVVRPGAVAEAVGHALDWPSAVLMLVAGEDRRQADEMWVHYLIGVSGELVHLSTALPRDRAAVPTLAARSFPASRFEREMRDLLGIVPLGHPDPRPLMRHGFWPETFHPLREDAVTPAFEDDGRPFPFTEVEGEGIYEIPVGPVHAGVIEPGHFRFSVLGETIVKMRARLYFTHKGTERLFAGRTANEGVALAERVSGDTSVGHALAFCQALEAVAGCDVPERAQQLRVVLLELERLYNHISDAGAIIADTGFQIGQAHCLRLRETLLRLNKSLTGHRLLRGAVVPGGIDQERDGSTTGVVSRLRAVVADFSEMMEICGTNTLVRDRLDGTGWLATSVATDFGVVGYVARACGIPRDVRADFPSGGYGALGVTPIVEPAGDVAARLTVRLGEIRQSVDLIERALARSTPPRLRTDLGVLPAFEAGFGLVEGWRGRIAHMVMAGRDGRLHRVKIVDPSFFNWPALARALEDNIVPDFPLCNKSFNQSYSGNDL
ncbi:MAG: NADH-quinone oxidoreductase subunit C [Vicinamibacterales bacterium]